MTVKICGACGFENVDDGDCCEECGQKLDDIDDGATVGGEGMKLPLTGDDAVAETPRTQDEQNTQVQKQPDESSLVCPSCHQPNAVEARFCNKCGARITPGGGGHVDGACPACRNPVDSEDVFCNACGARLSDTSAGVPDEPKVDKGEDVDEDAVLFRLVVVTGHNKDHVHRIDKTEARIGRSPDNDIALESDGYVSSIHTRIYRKGEAFWVEDLGSTNGTFIKVQGKTELKDQDEIKVGQSIFRFEKA